MDEILREEKGRQEREKRAGREIIREEGGKRRCLGKAELLVSQNWQSPDT